MQEYIIKLAYALAVVLFAANMITGLLWKILADKTKDPKIIAYTFKGIFYSDKLITIPSLLTIACLNFFVNADKYIFGLPLSAVITVLLIFGLLLFIFIVHPIRKKLFFLAAQGDQTSEFDIMQYSALSKKWVVSGLFELAPFMAVLILSLIL